MSSASDKSKLLISRASGKKSPLLAGTMSDTAAARLSHRFSDLAQFFSSLTHSGYFSKKSPTVWLHKPSHFAQLSTYFSIQVLSKAKSASSNFSTKFGSQKETINASSVMPERYSSSQSRKISFFSRSLTSFQCFLAILPTVSVLTP